MAKQRMTLRLDEEVSARLREYAQRTRRPINTSAELLLTSALDTADHQKKLEATYEEKMRRYA